MLIWPKKVIRNHHHHHRHQFYTNCRGQLECDGTRAENIFRLSAKWTSPIKSAGASVPSTTGSRGVRISGSNAGYTMFRGSVKGTRYPLHSPVSPSPPSRASKCAITLQLESNCCHVEYFTSFSLYGAAYDRRKPCPTLGQPAFVDMLALS